MDANGAFKRSVPARMPRAGSRGLDRVAAAAADHLTRVGRPTADMRLAPPLPMSEWIRAQRKALLA
jgi:hypothetical protein